MKSIGIVFGCFIPLHTGHLKLIGQSLCQCDQTVLVVSGYDTDRGQDFIPFRTRISLTKEAFQEYPNVLVIGVDDHAIGLTGTFSTDAWRRWGEELFRNAGLDPKAAGVTYHWYLGELSYLKKLVEVYPHHIFHLANREKLPISGTQIRERWQAYETDIHPIFFNYLEKSMKL